jgi:hypothetical protein
LNRSGRYQGIADGLASKLQLRTEDAFINLVEVKKENCTFSNGIALGWWRAGAKTESRT